MVAGTLLVAASLFEALVRPNMERSPLALVLVVAIAAPVIVRRSRPLLAMGAEVAAFLGVAVASFADKFPPDSLAVFPGVLAYSCGAHAPRRPGLIAAVALYIAMQVSVGFSQFPNVELALLSGGWWWVGRAVRIRRRLVDELSAQTRELEAAEETFVALSVRRERTQIARELHDVISHHLAVMVIQAGAGRMAPDVAPDRTAERLATIRTAGRQALADVAQLVDLLGTEATASSAGRLDEVLHRARAGPVDVVVSGADGLNVPPAIEDDVCRVIQEGLTNAMKHAPGARVELSLGWHDNDLMLDLRNGGSTQDSALTATGSSGGVEGMRSRVAALGGRLEAGPDSAGGWHLNARFPRH